ncbi:MAG: DNA-processing protein DprA [Oscillospiraceae bacterium]|jgi:DNA processing protein|nr:DNA-processing protein DprA [Oscillospiraceae bacterium]
MDTVYWLWLQNALGISSSLRTQEITGAFQGARHIYESSEYERRISGVFTNLQLSRLEKTALSGAQASLEECKRHSQHILTPQDAAYPAKLRELMNYPLALYVMGSLDCLQRHLGIAMVGTRRARRLSVDIAARLSASLVRAGCVIVSGGALGVDSAAHRGALAAGGQTIAVLGCGMPTEYLPENRALREAIVRRGALVTEYPPGTPALGHHFPTRNRIISGLSVGTVVVEAGERSGSLITAECAAEQGRDVFAVPGETFNSAYMGANKLIREGAKPVFAATDILEEYELLYPELLNMRGAERDLERQSLDPDQVPVMTRAPRKAKPARRREAVAPAPPEALPAAAAPGRDLSALEQALVRLLEQEAQHIDAIVKRSGQSLGAVFTALTDLEMDGMIRQLPGKLYISNVKPSEETCQS